MILPVYTYNHPVLKQRATPITEINDELLTFIDSMFETMYHAEGIGLAANQVGSNRNVTVIDLQRAEEDDGGPSEPLVLINPVIEAFSDDTEEFEEGCLSLPEFRDKVIRPEAIQVRFMDRDMREIVMEVDSLLARVMQHEIDHLNGIYFFERLSSIRRTLAQGKLKRIARGEFDADYETVTL
jgi:peptide deformylase